MPSNRRAVQDPAEGTAAERVEGDHLTAREQRGDHAKRGVLSRRADQGDRAGLDVGKQGILLGLVEAVDLVDKEECSQLGPAGGLDRLANLRNAG